jgi:hypothetical protein
MKTHHPQEWSSAESVMKSDELGSRFVEVLDFWTDTMEEGIRQNEFHLDHVFRLAFTKVEEKFGHLTIHWMGQIVAVIVQWWIHGEELYEALSPLESRIVEEALSQKMRELSELADSMGIEPDKAVTIEEFTKYLNEPKPAKNSSNQAL